MVPDYSTPYPYYTIRITYTSPYPPTGGNSIVWYGNWYPENKKKPFSLNEFLANKRRVTEAWHVCFKHELSCWMLATKINPIIITYFWQRPVEYIMRTWFNTDWRWVFKRWVQNLYAM
jgi:hypothetical protein